MGTLTVKENLSFSAALRLPSSMSKTEKEERVNMVLADLGLTGIANSKIGNQFIRGVSGGERKRTNIGMELVIQPNILFLDEPTTGLDAHTAVSVMKLLRDLAAQGRTIIFAIHQPRYSIFKLFDSLTLLANGQTVYHGDATKALKYFEENGLHCEEHDNPADFFLDIIQSFEDNQKAPSGLLCEVHENFTDSDLDTTLSVENDGKGSSGLSLVDAYKSSDLHNQTNANLEAMIHQQQLDDDRKADEHKQSVTYATNFLFQTWICMKRAATNVARDPQLSIFRVMSILERLGVKDGPM
jgi:ATP-binding cassette subfamily G (WHITE) protein 2